MKVRKFNGATAREALRKVKDALGPDALILSNRPVAGGVEITALAHEDAFALNAPPAKQEAQAEVDRIDVADIVDEIRMMRSLLEEQLAGFAWGDLSRREPMKVAALKKMLGAGFSPKFSRQMIDKMPHVKEEKTAMDWLRTAFTRNLNIANRETDIVDRGGVFALVGPTGVGKTTTTAKLAARCVVRHGADKLALVTTDSYRIGAHEQLRIYGRILGVPVHAIKDAADLSLILHELKDKHLVLIDTIGMSQKDQKVIDQVAMLSGCETDVERLLLLNATSSGDTLDDVVRAYRGSGLGGCILTKVDEAIGLGAALDVIMRNRLTLHFIANGQRVPEDIHAANASYLVDRAFRASKEDSPHALGDVEYPLVMAHGMYGHTVGA
ncbi:MAG: flagellar biosynthesis protein FlhF [Burkholderiales bacterium]|nr:flagellar biosynthesis protein FlhF [Burkholderiales bacterium]